MFYIPLALTLMLGLSTVVSAQEGTVQLDLKQNSIPVITVPAGTDIKKSFRIESGMPDDRKVCVDDAMTRCVTVGEVRALAHIEGEIGQLDQARRELLGFQSLYSTTLSELDQCRGQLGPLRAQATQRTVEEQFAAWIADLEKRNPGWIYDRQTGALVKAPEKKPGG